MKKNMSVVSNIFGGCFGRMAERFFMAKRNIDGKRGFRALVWFCCAALDKGGLRFVDN